MALRKKTGATEAREKLFDRVFKPQEMLLPNGHSVMRPRSRLAADLGGYTDRDRVGAVVHGV